jgi:hypothetical protein
MYCRWKGVILLLHGLLISDGELPTTVRVPPQCSFSSSTSTVILASALSVLTTAILATVIFVLVQIALCKYHPKFKPGRAETGTSAGEEGQEYEQVDGGVGDVPWTRGQEQVSGGDPTHMEVGVEETTIELKETDAYNIVC